MCVAKRRWRDLAAAVMGIALLLYAFAPIVHGFIHPDHEIVAALHADSGDRTQSHHHPAQHQDEDCALFKLYAGHGAGALSAPSPTILPQPVLFAAQAPLLHIDPLPAGAPRGFALGRGPPPLA